MTKENYVKERQPYSISSRKDGRFITTVRKEDEERQQIAAPSKNLCQPIVYRGHAIRRNQSVYGA